MREKNINATLSLQSNLHGYVDHEGFTKIVSNLINNAVKYCLSYVSVTLKTDDTQLFFIVANDGNIIPMELRERIFEPFFRIDTAEHSTSGTGIGLALARSLAELHNGHLRMGNETDTNVFVLTLPLVQDVPVRLDTNGKGDVTTVKAEPEIIQETQAKPYTLLLVEDNVQMLQYEKRCLEREYNIITAHDGESALRFARMRYDDPDGDYGRQKRQRIVIEKLVEKLMSFSSITNFEQLMNAVSKNVKTDVPIGQVMALKNTYGPALTSENLSQAFMDERQLLLKNNEGQQVYYSYATDEVLLKTSNSIRQLLEKSAVKTYPLLQQREDLYYLTIP